MTINVRTDPGSGRFGRRATQGAGWRLLVLLTCLAGCGGGGSGAGATGGEDVDVPVAVEEPTGPGRTLSVERLGLAGAAEVRQAHAALGASAPPLQVVCDVVAWRIVYLGTMGCPA